MFYKHLDFYYYKFIRKIWSFTNKMSENKNVLYDLKNISISKQFLMGFSILWIVLYHSITATDVKLVYPAYLKFIIVSGLCGVDIFTFLSGFGIYFSLNKDSDEMNFYKRRVLRLLPILPLAIIDIIIFSIIQNNHITFVQILGYILQVNYWIFPIESYKLYFWYISFIIVCYFIAPILYNIIEKSKGNIKFLSLIVGVLFVLTIPFHNLYYCSAVCRFPIFFFGMCLGYYYLNKQKISQNFVNLIYIAGIIAFGIIIAMVSLHYENLYIKYCLFFFVGSALCFILSEINSFLIKNEVSKRISNIFIFLGICSLEIYVVDCIFIHRFIVERLTTPFYLLCCFSLGGGIIYHLIYNYIKELITKKNIIKQ